MDAQMSKLSLQDDSYVMVVAIEFGTAYSTYAFSFKNSPDEIKMNKNWGANFGFQSWKTPTCVLTGPDDNFLEFGYEAENRYADMESKHGISNNYHLYRLNKMMLDSENKAMIGKTLITSVSGKKRRALDIFVMALRFLKSHVIEAVSRNVASHMFDENMERWVLTVPAIWSDEAKQSMRVAAFQAGLIQAEGSKKLRIVTEPEAVSFLCRTLEINCFVENISSRTVDFQTGTKYMVINAGDTTVDITVHELLSSSKVKVLYSGNGAALGEKVNENVVKLLSKILGNKFVEVYKKECPENWEMLMKSVDKIKKSIKPDGKIQLVFQLSCSMGIKYREIMGGDIETSIRKAAGLGVTYSNGHIYIKPETTVGLFAPAVEGLIKQIDELMKIPKLKSCEYFMLVGAFGEVPFLQASIHRRFGDKVCILVPCESELSVIKGAVLLGHQPNEKQ